MVCVICKNKITPDPGGWAGGHNPWPIKKKGKCCGKCNYEKVTPKRLEQYKRRINNGI
tara:strand:+ start:146 stop:319 length:174 start_codon:yes stop_codon:yes gene_type:complete